MQRLQKGSRMGKLSEIMGKVRDMVKVAIERLKTAFRRG